MVFLAERTFTSEFWLFALISDPLAFLILAFAPVIWPRVRNVALLTFGKLLMVLGIILGYLWPVGIIHIASGCFQFFFFGLGTLLASGWLFILEAS